MGHVMLKLHAGNVLALEDTLNAIVQRAWAGAS